MWWLILGVNLERFFGQEGWKTIAFKCAVRGCQKESSESPGQERSALSMGECHTVDDGEWGGWSRSASF